MADPHHHYHHQSDPLGTSSLQHIPIRGAPRDNSRNRESSATVMLADYPFKPETPRPTTPTKSFTNRRFPENLHFKSSNLRLRSPTASSVASSISSALIPDSATTHSAASTLASPLSTSYASEVQEMFAAHTLDDSTPQRKSRHRYQPSSGSSFTFVNDEEPEDVFHTDLSVVDSKLRYGDDFRMPIAIRPSTLDLDLESSRSSVRDDASIKEEDVSTPCKYTEDDQSSETMPDTCTPKCDSSSSSASEDNELSRQDADSILDYTLQIVYGMDLQDAPIKPTISRQLVDNFVRDVNRHIWQATPDSQQTGTMSGMSSSSSPSQGDSVGQHPNGPGKRKKQQGGRGDEDGDEFSDGEGSGYLPMKRTRPNPKEEENLRLSCPYRKRNPHRFNVRDHHSCAMTYFPKFAELRQHIVKQHKRDDPSAFVCDRCNRDFVTRKELRDHQRLPKEQMCDIADHDPESGIDGPTSNKLLSRKRASGSSPEVQWKEIWNILFPDDDDDRVKPYPYVPVIEHFELSSHFMSSFRYLQYSLRDKISNQATLDTLAAKFHQCFIETVERCMADAQNLPYSNRSNKRNEPGGGRVQSTQNLLSVGVIPGGDDGSGMGGGSGYHPAVGASSGGSGSGSGSARGSLGATGAGAGGLVVTKGRELLPRPDSGVIMDDGSDEGGSVLAAGLSHRDSVKTVKLRNSQGTNISGPSSDSLGPTPPTTTEGVFDERLLQQYTAIPPSSTIDISTMQAWSSQGLTPMSSHNNNHNHHHHHHQHPVSQHGGCHATLSTGGLAPGEQYMDPGLLTPQAAGPGVVDWADFSFMGEAFNGFNAPQHHF